MSNNADRIFELQAQVDGGNSGSGFFGGLHGLVAEEIASNPEWNISGKDLRSVVFQCIKRETENDVPGLIGTPVMDAFLDFQAEHGR